MGGLAKKVPVTAGVMLLAFAAIIGIPGFAGFWSKDLILEKLYMSGPMGPAFYAVGLLTAVITAVYMTRLIIMTFFGSYRGSKESEAHIHEAPACMLIPMVILAIGAVATGYLWAESLGLTTFEHSLAPVVGEAQLSVAHSAAHVNPMMFAALGTLAALVGIVIAYVAFKKVPAATASTRPEGCKATWTFLFDIIHGWFIGLTNVIAWIIDNCVDKLVQFVQWLVANITLILGDGAASFQVRKVRLQLALSIAGVALLVLVVLLTGGMI